MLSRRAKARAVHGADHQRGLGLAAEHIAKFRRLIEDLIEAHAHEVDEHQLADRAQPRSRRADCGTDEARFADRGVHDAITIFAV